ncbi:hypothetical protein [Candidatus Rhabdochlamydia porcellionis]|jgi:hypothetical protein|uniref:Uncharacterized protein n=1 Tax=Candidatus Rhabdochlamydia porcellionis TaxID=225148 RepID=A0ABX8Z4F0_9BACT|nr:hypothetical protein [Candidatus Rhabdochlamydia porcellionis]QZA59387.1 hypothetical protein RHAB15C_0001273 [Candidatus Rhabdochlamydia porcellionis]
MNVLPFIFAIFAIFTFLFNSLLKNTKETGILTHGIEDFYQLQQKYLNGVAGLSYKSLTIQKQGNLPKTPINRRTEYKSPRFSQALKGSQLNLYPLIQEQKPQNHPFYAITARLLCLIYPAILPDNQAACALLDALLAKAKTLNEPILNELMPEDPLLQESYYKIIQGTNQYDIKQKKGIPPLADFLMIYKNEACCYLCSAHFLVLQAMFGEDFTHTIIAGEKKKWESGKAKLFNKQELESLIKQYPTETALYETIKKYCRAQLNQKKAVSKKTQNGISFRKES